MKENSSGSNKSSKFSASQYILYDTKSHDMIS